MKEEFEELRIDLIVLGEDVIVTSQNCYGGAGGPNESTDLDEI